MPCLCIFYNSKGAIMSVHRILRINASINILTMKGLRGLKYKPIEIVEIIPNCDNYDEDKYTKIYMDKYGVDKVHEGSYCTII